MLRKTLLMLVLVVFVVSATDALGQVCQVNKHCPRGQYCKKAVGDCDGFGICVRKPDACTQIYNPVCGCDGKTYGNACMAANAGVNVDYRDVCMPERGSECKDNSDCGPKHYCKKAIGDCDGEGVCERRPRFCIMIYDPVCGCDGKTYSNSCVAAQAGVSIDYEGTCETGGDECRTNADCGFFEYCRKEVGDCDGFGKCVLRPEMCLDVWDPVCGCDGKTYSNSCYAARAGVSIDYMDACNDVTDRLGEPCMTNADCGFLFSWKKIGFRQYCKKDVGDCDGEGICALRPEMCLDVWLPVCGCDGNTYSNHCYAARVGVNVDYEDACASVRGTCTTNADCGFREYCKKAVGDCNGEGVCSIRPRFCLDWWIPVCGCDGRIYSNDCYAARNGVNVEFMGPCPY